MLNFISSKKKKRLINFTTVLMALTFIVIPLIGCGGGGGGGSSAQGSNPVKTPDISVSESQVAFNGVVINEFMDKTITVRNAGTANLVIGQIAQANPLAAPFSITSDTCSGQTLQPTWTCALQIQFAPKSIAAFQDSFDIPSNDPDENPLTVVVSGDGNGLNVTINQVFTNKCPEVDLLTSVTDADGNAINNLTESNFSILENDQPVGTFTISTAAVPASITFIFDYSDSFSSALSAALAGAKIFIGNMNLNSSPSSDEGAVIKFSTNIVNMTEIVASTLFTSDETLLNDSIDEPIPGGGLSRFYDAVYEAITEISTRNKLKRAIITYSDGKDAGSTKTLDEVIGYAVAEGVPVFTIGIGSVDGNVLATLANDTGGQYFYAPTESDLNSIYQQISDLLAGQYVVTYNSTPNGGITNTSKVSVDYNNLYGEDSKEFTGCP